MEAKERSVYPQKFRDICTSVYMEDEKYDITDGIEYLKKYAKADGYSSDKTNAAAYVRWIDKFFGECMFPLELHDDDWERFVSDIVFLLETSYKRLVFINGRKPNFSDNHKTKESFMDEQDLIHIFHNMDVYLYIAYMKSGRFFDQKTYVVRERLLRASVQNVEYLLNHKEAEILKALDRGAIKDLYLHGMDYWQEPLAWLYHEATYNRMTCDLAKIYDCYYTALIKMTVPDENRNLKKWYIDIAKMRLKKICELAISFYDDLILEYREDAGDETAGWILEAEKKEYERIIEESEVRECISF